MAESDDLLSMRMGDKLSPAPSAEIEVSRIARLRIFRSFRHRVTYRTVLDRPWSYFLQGPVFLVISGGILTTALLSFPDIGIGISKPRLSGVVFVALYFLLLLCYKGLRRWESKRNADSGNTPPEFEDKHAETWAKAAKQVLNKCASKIAGDIASFVDDKKVPYRIIKGYLPVPPIRLRRPREYMKKQPGKRAAKWRKERIFHIDSLSAAALSLLGAKPFPRFESNRQGDREPRVHDLYWRNDVQEVPDADQADIFLRFHQSVIEREIAQTCYYKTFAALNNYRQTPILLITVQDIVDCLKNPNLNYAESEHKQIYKNLNDVDPDNILDVLQEKAFQRFPPRMERVGKVDKIPAPIVGPILEKGRDGDWVMQFDPARVWVDPTNDLPKYAEAIAMLRYAIHLVSRSRTTEIVLKKRDLLIVDNRRALIAREEDTPSHTCIDQWASKYESLQGRWLRKIYGTQDDYPDGKNNFDNNLEAADRAKSANPAANEPGNLPAGLAQQPAGEDMFDFGSNPENWPPGVQH